MAGKHRKTDTESEVRKAHSRVVHAGSRGGHVGLTSPDDALDVEETAADTRDARP